MTVKLTTRNWQAVMHSDECKHRILRDLPALHPEHREDVLRVLVMQAEDDALKRMADILEREIGRRTWQPVGKGIGSLDTPVDTLSRSNCPVEATSTPERFAIPPGTSTLLQAACRRPSV